MGKTQKFPPVFFFFFVFALSQFRGPNYLGAWNREEPSSWNRLVRRPSNLMGSWLVKFSSERGAKNIYQEFTEVEGTA